MHQSKTFAAALIATTIFVGGSAFATDHAAQAADQSNAANNNSQQQQVGNDVKTMSRDAQLAFADIGHTRASIFDGDIDTAKKLMKQASAAFNRAKNDRSVLIKAEANQQSSDHGQQAANANGAKSGSSNGTANKTPAAGESSKNETEWLPVDGAVTINEDYTADPNKSSAVKDANQKLANGDRKGAIEKLKLAKVDVDFLIAAVPVNETSGNIDQAEKLLQDGKYYETSQILRKIEDSVHFVSYDATGTPKSVDPDTGRSSTNH